MAKLAPFVAWTGDSEPSLEQRSVKDENFELAWGFRPIMLLLRCIGIDLNWGDDRSCHGRLFTYLNRVFWLLSGIVLVYADSYYLFANFGTKFIINMTIHVITFAIRGFGIYCALLFTTWKQGHGLVESFKKIEARFKISQQAVKKIRGIALFGAVVTAISVSKVYFQIR